MANDTAAQVAEEFCFVANAVYGLYLDTAMALGNLATSYMDYHNKHLKQLEASGETTLPGAVNPTVVYSAESGGETKPVHQTTLVDLINRNKLDGRHMQFLARMCVVALYQYWEDEFRPRLAKALGQNLADLKHDTFGELRHLRRSVIHRNGRAVDECAEAQALPQFTPGSEVVLDQRSMDQIVSAVKQAALQLAQAAGAA